MPWARWNFESELRDELGSLHATPHGSATRGDRGLALDGRTGFAATPPLNKDLRAKSLEVWLSLADFKQAGGGAIGVQALDGSVFDAIVFGEREPDCWMAGSNNFARTQSFDGPPETAADKELVQIVIVYCDDGTIRCYRNGDPYGKPYRTAGPVTFSAAQSEVIFGLRHGSPGGNRMLSGVISRAALYDRALSADEVAASTAAGSNFVPEAAIVARLAPAAVAERARLVEGLRARQAAASETARRMCYAVTPRFDEPAHLLLRYGDIRNVGPVVAAGALGAIKGLNPDFGLAADAPEESRRAALARWITSPANPLFSRVIVNRLWHHHFGIGLVDTPNDFGFNGARPSHRDLLDFLANALVAERWSLKQLHRTIVLSATYRQAALPNARAVALDADNRLLWRKTPRRLEAESVRDAILAVAGELNPMRGGPGFRDCTEVLRSGSYSYLPGDPIGPEFNRRSIYRTWTRGGRSGLLDAFDCPDPSTMSPRRAQTITPLQALVLLNNSFVLRTADQFAMRVEREAGAMPERQVARAYQLAFGRDATPDELALAIETAQRFGFNVVARAIFNSNEFLYVD